jgi:hypothetical protein
LVHQFILQLDITRHVNNGPALVTAMWSSPTLPETPAPADWAWAGKHYNGFGKERIVRFARQSKACALSVAFCIRCSLPQLSPKRRSQQTGRELLDVGEVGNAAEDPLIRV